MYDQNQNQNVKRGDYIVPAKSMNTMLGYEYIHNPQLFNATKLGRDMAKTQAEGFQKSASASASRTGMSLTNAGQTMSKNINPT